MATGLVAAHQKLECRSIPFFVGSSDRLWSGKDKHKKGHVVNTHHTPWIMMLCPQPFATGTVPAFMAPHLRFRSCWLKVVMLLLGPGSLRPISETMERLARLNVANIPHLNRTSEDIYHALTAITADCPRWSPKLINTTRIPINTMATRSASSL